MDPARLIRRFPRLYHMAEFGSWPAICEHGLLSTTALLDLFDVRGAERDGLESEWRPVSATITHPVHGRAVIRDQLPLRPERLAKLLSSGMTPADWYRTLNRHVFFWVDEAHLNTLLGARAYRNHAQTVITLDTERLLGRYFEEIRLSSINSGSIIRGGARRGRETFRRIGDHDQSRLVELCVVDRVLDVEEFAISVDHRWPDQRRRQLWPSKAAGAR